MRRRICRFLLTIAALLGLAVPAGADLLGRFEVLDARSRGADGSSAAAIVWSLDTLSGELWACNAADADCVSAGPWKPGEPGAQRYRIASQYVDGSGTAYVWIIDTAAGEIRRCRAALAAAPELVCGK